MLDSWNMFSSAWCISWKVGLSLGFHCQHWRINSYILGGQPGGHSMRYPFSSIWYTSVRSTPGYGDIPYVAISHSRIPNAHTSDWNRPEQVGAAHGTQWLNSAFWTRDFVPFTQQALTTALSNINKLIFVMTAYMFSVWQKFTFRWISALKTWRGSYWKPVQEVRLEINRQRNRSCLVNRQSIKLQYEDR
jgi:hypothetical protein